MLYQEIPNAERGASIDVRSRENFDLSHHPGSVNIPWDMHLYYLKDLEDLPHPWIFVCDAGWRSGQVVLSLKTLGFDDLFNAGSWSDLPDSPAGNKAA